MRCFARPTTLAFRAARRYAGPASLIGSVRLMGKRSREGTGADRRGGDRDPLGPDLDELLGLNDDEDELLMEPKDREKEQKDELMALLDEIGVVDDLEDDFFEDEPREEAKGNEGRRLILEKKLRRHFDIKGIDFEENAKAYNIGDMDLLELSEEDLQELPTPPAPEVRPLINADLVTGSKVTEHAPEHIGMYYPMGESANKLPEFLQLQMEREWKQSKGKMLMIREVCLDVAAEVKKGSGQLILIDGKKGMGKSSTAVYAAHYALESGQLVLSCGLDGIGLWDDKIGRIETDPVKGLAYPSVYRMPDMSQRYFHWLRDKYEKEMKQITLKKDHGVTDYYHIPPWEDEIEEEANPTKKISIERIVPEDERGDSPTLYDFLNYASQERTVAANLTAGFFQEIQAITELKVCIVLDEFNSLIINHREMLSTKSDFVETGVWKEIPRARLSLIDGFLYLAENPPSNGTVVVSPTYNRHKKQGLRWYEKYHVSKKFEVERYSIEEHKNAFLHYSLSCALDPVVNMNKLPRITGLTARYPYELRRYTEMGVG